jgi:small Trp-rich protein
MPFVAIGTVLLLLKMFDVEPVVGWSWIWILAPFGAAVAWWVYADSSGLTQKRAMRRMEERKQARRERDLEALGLNIDSDRRKRAVRKTAEAGRERAAGSGGAPGSDSRKPD